MTTYHYYDFLRYRTRGKTFYKDVKVRARNPQEALQYFLHREKLPRKDDLYVISKYSNVLRIYQYKVVHHGKRGRTVTQYKKTAEWNTLDIPLIKSKRI